MAVRIILAPVSGMEQPNTTLDTALQVGRQMNAHVEAFHVSLDPRGSAAYMAEGMTSNIHRDIMNAVEQEGKERRDRARRRFEDACKRCNAPVTVGRAPGGFAASFATALGREDELLAMRGRVSDLIVVARSPNQGDATRTTIDIAVLETGRPVLIAPPRAVSAFGTTIAVVWNGTIEATRAVEAGLQFITAAQRVVILALPERHYGGTAVQDLVTYLSCHGVTAETVDIHDVRGGRGHALVRGAQQAGCDMMVMGAYTRSRLRHLVFGGATSEVLVQSGIPVLMSH
ncbi:MAG: universal stress protein [Alphaproteobacteria bacterium]|nr:universal stress protein [Alphaproteobacteria bacterium]